MSTASEARRWLEARETSAPPSLRERITAALAEPGLRDAATRGRGDAAKVEEALAASPPRRVAASGVVAAELAEAALRRLDAVLASGGGRQVAFDLLAADALLTAACAAAAEAGPEALSALVRAYGAARLADLFPRREDTDP